MKIQPKHVVVAFLLPALGAAFVAPSVRPTVRLVHVPTTTSSYKSIPSSTPLFTTSSSLESASTGDAEEVGLGKKVFDKYVQVSNVLTTMFPVWTLLCTGYALKSPQSFSWFTTEYFTAGLAVLMLSMGITLSPADFAKVAKRPNAVVMQFALCYLMMPALALTLGRAFGLSPALVAGMVLVGSINGGQASNLCTYIARGNVALSVLMTTATTIGAIFMTPILCKAFLGQVVPVDAVGISISTLQVVLAPIAVGMVTNKFFPKFVDAILPITPVIGVISTCLLVASAVAQVAEPILNAGLQLQIPVMLLHFIGGIVGYTLPRLTGFGEIASRTMAIETSMKSSAFGFLLAKLHFGEYAARVPSAVSVAWMALTGAMLAVFWRFKPIDNTGDFDRSLVDKYPPFSPKNAMNKVLKFLKLKKE